MKPVRCSWVDMQKVRASLSGGKRGDQKRLEETRCVDKATVSKWKAATDLMGVMDGKVAISQLSSFQPTISNWKATCDVMGRMGKVEISQLSGFAHKCRNGREF